MWVNSISKALPTACAVIVAALIASIAITSKPALAQTKQPIVIRVADEPAAVGVYGAFWIANLKGTFARTASRLSATPSPTAPQPN
jgi:hypothetical protein